MDLKSKLLDYLVGLKTEADILTDKIIVVRTELGTDAVPNWRRFELEDEEKTLETKIRLLLRLYGELVRLLNEKTI